MNSLLLYTPHEYYIKCVCVCIYIYTNDVSIINHSFSAGGFIKQGSYLESVPLSYTYICVYIYIHIVLFTAAMENQNQFDEYRIINHRTKWAMTSTNCRITRGKVDTSWGLAPVI